MSNQYHSRPSTFGDGYTAPQQRLMDKQREYEAFFKIHQQAQDLLNFFNHFGDKYDVLDGGSEGKRGFGAESAGERDASSQSEADVPFPDALQLSAMS